MKRRLIVALAFAVLVVGFAAPADAHHKPGHGTTTTTEPPTTTTTEPPPTTTSSTTTITTPPTGGVPTGADYGFPSCISTGRNVVTPFPSGTVLTTRYRVSAPPDDTTYDLTGVQSTAQPSSSYPFSFGTGNDNLDAALRTCMVGGELLDQFGDPPSVGGQPIDWRTWHDTYNAACVKIAAADWMQVQGHTCRGIQDGFRMQENLPNANNTRFLIEDTYAGNMGDDCLENDYTTEGVILDSLFDGCLNAFSERPSGDRCWETPADEQLVIDHSLFRLRPVLNPGGDFPGVTGYGRLFKWPSQCGTMNVANQPVIKCSTFLVPDYRLDGGVNGMEWPANTIVDDSACPDDPSTIVWLGGGDTYPAAHPAGIRTVTDIGYWDAKVAGWNAAHSESPPLPDPEPGPIAGQGLTKVYDEDFDTLSSTWVEFPWFPARNGNTVENGSLHVRTKAFDPFPVGNEATTLGPRSETYPHYPEAKTWKGPWVYFEARFRYTNNPWTVPAFWLYSVGRANHWPDPDAWCPNTNPEWDIVEGNIASYGADRLSTMGLHKNTNSYCGIADEVQVNWTPDHGSGLSDWHTWSGYWTDAHLIQYLDGVPQTFMPHNGWLNTPLFLILHIDEGSTTPPGDPPKAWQYELEVDYVEVWEKP